MNLSTEYHPQCKFTKYFTIRFGPDKCPTCGTPRETKIPKYYTVTINPKQEKMKRMNLKMNILLGNTKSCDCNQCNPDTSNNYEKI